MNDEAGEQAKRTLIREALAKVDAAREKTDEAARIIAYLKDEMDQGELAPH